MIQALSKQITEYMFYYDEDRESFEIHQYGVEVILSTFINVLLIIIIGLFSNKVIEGLIYCIGFYAIRKFCGGYHCHTYFKCISLHVFLFIVYLLTNIYYEKIFLYISIIAVIIFTLYAPITNRDLSIKQYRVYKFISLFILMGYIMLAYMTPYTSIIIYILMIVSVLIVACIRDYEENII